MTHTSSGDPSNAFRRRSAEPPPLSVPWHTRTPSDCVVHGIGLPLIVWPANTLVIGAACAGAATTAAMNAATNTSRHLFIRGTHARQILRGMRRFGSADQQPAAEHALEDLAVAVA